MSDLDKATPRPWKLSLGSTHITGVCKFESIHGMYPNYEANAALIVTAVNNYDTALTRIRELKSHLRIAREAIRGETIEGAVVDLQTMQSLGDMLDAALSSKDQEKTNG